MSNFDHKKYLALLQRQVEEEISYLQSHSHTSDRNYLPCMFCRLRPQGYYTCTRLNDLHNFLASITSHEDSRVRKVFDRKRIGFQAEEFPDSSAEKLPLLFPCV